MWLLGRRASQEEGIDITSFLSLLSGQSIHMLLSAHKNNECKGAFTLDFSLTRHIPICHQHSLYKGSLIYPCMEFKLPMHMRIWNNMGCTEHCFWNFTFHLQVTRTQQRRRTHGFCIPVGNDHLEIRPQPKDLSLPVLRFSPGLPWRAIKGEVLIF